MGDLVVGTSPTEAQRTAACDPRQAAPGQRPLVVQGRLDLEAFLDSPIGALSKGQRKRAVLAMGLLAPSPLLLCDEPFDGLDLRQNREVTASLRLGRLGTYGNTATPNANFGLASAGLANIDPPRMVQFEARFTF